MQILEDFLRSDRPAEPEDTDALLELADLTRELAARGDRAGLSRLIARTVGRSDFEALSWILAILQEEFGKADGTLGDFSCPLGASIPAYNEFIGRLQVDLRVMANDVRAIPDEHGEIQSFFHIFTYRTMYDNIFFVSAENFDTKDNDFIRYELRFVRS